MSTPAAASGTATWSEQSFADALQIIAEGLTELVGFGMAVISVRREDRFVVVALAGAETARRANGARDGIDDMLGTSWPVARLERLLDVAEDWGRFKFVAHDRAPRGGWMWVREAQAVEGADAWHPNDGALAPIHDATGRLVGAISVDDPRTGRQPDAAQRRVMDRYAAQAAQVVLSALEREALERRLKLAESTRQLIRAASRHLALDALLDETGPAFLEAFAASGLWLRVHGSAEVVLSGPHALPPGMPPAAIAGTVARAAERLWERQHAAVLYTDGRDRDSVLAESEVGAIRQVLTDADIGSVLHAPIGAGDECLGSLILVRDGGQPDWSGAEVDQAAEVGRDLGRIIWNGRTYSHVQELVRELRELDAHKSHLIAMVSHELKNPLTVLLANRDILEPELAGDAAALERLADIDAGAQRMSGVVDNLLLLARLADPETPHEERDLDLRPLLDEVAAALATSLAQRGVSLRITASEGPLLVRGDAGELRTVLANLIGNGLKFSDEGGAVEVAATRSGDGLEIAVTDHGIGISAEDREQLFSDFFRSQDPAALERPGSGLGLAIVDRILRRHRGRAEVTSTPGRGTTVRIYLPTPAG